MSLLDKASASNLSSGHDSASSSAASVEERPEVPAEKLETQEDPVAALAEAVADPPAAAKPAAERKEPAAEDFASVLESFEAAQTETLAALEHKVIAGRVVKLTPNHVVVDIGAKSEGLVPIAQALGPDGNAAFKPGDEILVVIEHGESEEGYPKLSHERARRMHAWEAIEKAYHEKLNLTGRVVDRVKGGLSVDLGGAVAFLPGSQVEVRPAHNLDGLKGQEIQVRVIKLNKKRGNVVVSRKAILEEGLAVERANTLQHLEEGAVLTATIKNLTDYGAFVDLGGIDGLLHITDMSWGRLTHPRDLVRVGDEIHVKVLKFDKEKQRVSLGFKQLTPDPWLDATERYPVGARVKGKVISVTDYGAFIELEQGIEGLVHVSEMTWSKRMKHPSKIVNVGDQVETAVLSVNPADRRISLGLKQLETNPWDTLQQKYPVGAAVEGRVRNLTDFGAFIEIEEGIDGLVHISNLSWTRRVKHPSEVLKKGDRVKAQVLAIEPQNRRLSLGMKQLQPDVWQAFFQEHRVGDVVRGKVLRTAQFGAFVEISQGVEALCHNSESVDEKGASLKLQPGDERDFKIAKLNPEEKKIGLSLRGVGAEATRADVEAYKQPVASSSGTTTLGEIMSLKRASNDQN